MTPVDLANLLVAAVLLAGIYAVMSVGMTVIYGVMKIVNLAHAGFMMLGAYFALELFERFHLDPILAALAVFPLLMIIGIIIHWTLVRWLPQSDQPTLASLLLMFGLWLVLQNLGYVIWGNTDRSIFTPRTLTVIHLGPLVLPTIRAYVFVVGVACVLLLEALLNWTWFGRALRALVQNRYAGQIVGVDDQKIAGLTFGMGIAFAGLAGGLLASLYSFQPDFGRQFLIRAFVIIVLGGLESVSGVAIGALVLALVETFSIIWVPAGYQLAISFGLLVVVLIVLPGGIASLLGRARRLA
ncbi:MAG: branched-chain amino acid ABC transporter permease [Alphaproteobacteria bacterium]